MINKYLKLGKRELFPLCRSITGYGTKQTLKIIKNEFPKLKIHRVRSGTKVFDWKIPSEWNIFEAYVLDKHNKKIIDFKKNNLHIVSYSTPIKKKIIKKKLLNHLHSIPSMPNAIPYVTSYYKKYWGFCVQHSKKKKIQ